MLLHQLVHLVRIEVHSGAVAPAVDHGLNQVDTHVLHLLVHHLLQAVAQGDDHNHRSHADDNAQHGQKRPHLAGAQGLDGQAEGLRKVHASTSASSACTTALGSAASPS